MKELEFTNPLAEDVEPVAFTIIGTRSGDKARERFECLVEPPFATIQLLLGRNVDMAAYIRLCLKPHEEERWDRLLADKNFRVNPKIVRDIYFALVEHYADRPTQAPGDSGPGRGSTEELSMADGDSPDSTSEPSPGTSEQPRTSLPQSSGP